ncbi:MAG TPA: CbiX/SirB N-terminal domain-containing protein [Candidatus Methylacidiphilales bacterium]|nr:CbiX/SirB N-terminal domain-containing protein [Candidatus Methylacidiphilales bacterium]
MPVRDAALLLLGHGSTLNADSSAPTYRHAEEIRRRGVFAEVHVAFWKEEPNFRQALRLVSRRRVYAVPNFISSGYFTEQIIPRELGLDGPITRREGHEIYYCEPVGLHPSMTEALLRRANEVVAASAETIREPEKTACLLICGHGTSLNDNSTKIIHEQAAVIRARGLFADCRAVLMEQSPFVKDWRVLTACPNVIVVPFFIADGLHSFEDIPVLLGLTHNVKERGFANPHRENGRRLWYAMAIGTEAFLADVILAQVQRFEEQHPGISGAPESSEPARAMEDQLARFFEQSLPPWIIGEVLIQPGFQLRHRKDHDLGPAKLQRVNSIAELREWILLDPGGNFRPLRTAPNLRPGWVYHAGDLAAVHLALDYLYPAALANWELWQRGRLVSTPWPETAGRQTGRFRIVREIGDYALNELVAQHCQPGCLKRRLWFPAASTAGENPSEIPLLCPEACNFLVAQAREKLKGSEEE